MHLPLPDSVAPVLRSLREAGFKPYLAGGGVRDWLLGQPHTDRFFRAMVAPT